MSRNRTKGPRAPRRAVRVQVHYWNDVLDGQGVTSDVSSTGAFIESDDRLEAGIQLHLEFFLPHCSVFGEAMIVRCVKQTTPDRPAGFGVRFSDLGNLLRQGLEIQWEAPD